MRMTEWAEKEVALACERERNGKDESEWGDYGCACYESALKAFKSLCEDGHSGMSFSFTKNILIRLMNGSPLTPINDTHDIWTDETIYGPDREYVEAWYQCKRKSSLFKTVYKDGTVKYNDIDRFVCVDNRSNNTYHNGFITDIGHEMFPIEMPYIPEDKPFKIYCTDFLSDPKNGDFDTIIIHNIVTPDNVSVDINRFFKSHRRGWEEIDREELMERRIKADELKRQRGE